MVDTDSDEYPLVMQQRCFAPKSSTSLINTDGGDVFSEIDHFKGHIPHWCTPFHLDQIITGKSMVCTMHLHILEECMQIHTVCHDSAMIRRLAMTTIQTMNTSICGISAAAARLDRNHESLRAARHAQLVGCSRRFMA